jgi:hypothetical protein
MPDTKPGTIGVGERVAVMTRLGQVLTHGTVVATAPNGLTLRESKAGHHGFYSGMLHRFVVMDNDQPYQPVLVIDKVLVDAGGRVMEAKTGPAHLVKKKADQDALKKKAQKPETNKNAQAAQDAASAALEAANLVGKAMKPPKTKSAEVEKGPKPDGKEDDPDAPVKKAANVVDGLPDPIKKRVGAGDEISDEIRLRVLGDVADAALASLKRSGLGADRMYALVDAIQAATDDVLREFGVQDDGE